MSDLKMIRYKFTAVENWIEKIHLIEKDGVLVDGERQSFNIKKSPLRLELEKWLEIEGNEIEAYLTESELIEKQAKDEADALENSIKSTERDLISSDGDISRGIEDVISILLSKELIISDDIPTELKDKITARETLRITLTNLKNN